VKRVVGEGLFLLPNSETGRGGREAFLLPNSETGKERKDKGLRYWPTVKREKKRRDRSTHY